MKRRATVMLERMVRTHIITINVWPLSSPGLYDSVADASAIVTENKDTR
jgi:hypothetical protein